MSGTSGNKKILVAFAGYPNTGKSTILKQITEYVQGNVAKSSTLSNFREVMSDNIKIIDHCG
jgi:ribosome biogenesis GTPase A